MSFDTIRNNLDTLSNPIYIEELLESIMKLIDDAKEENHAQSFSVSEEDLYIKKLYNLVAFISKDYTDHSDIISDLMDRYPRYISEADTEIKDLQKKAEDESRIVELKVKKEAELEKERGHLLGLREQNEELQRRIDILSDPHLDSLADENTRLERDLSDRRAKESDLNKAIKQNQSDIKNAIDNITDLEKEEERLKKEKEDRESQRNTLDTSIGEINKWKEEFDKWYTGVDKEVIKATAQMSVMQNAWNSLGSDNTKIANLDEIKAWFEAQSTDIEKLLEEYRQRLKSVVQATEDMMKPTL